MNGVMAKCLHFYDCPLFEIVILKLNPWTFIEFCCCFVIAETLLVEQTCRMKV